MWHLQENNGSLTIIELLPYSNDTVFANRQQKLDALELIHSVIEFAIAGLEHFIKLELSLFDAQVGDNLCQIRAYNLLILAEKWLKNQDKKEIFLKKNLEIKRYKINLKSAYYTWKKAVDDRVQREKSLDSNEDIHSFLSRQNLLINFQQDIVFLIMCYFLTHVALRDEMIPIAINYEKLVKEMKISQYRAKRIIHKYQLAISKMGCDFILNAARNLSYENSYTGLLPKLCRISDENRTVLPCLIVMDIILNHCINRKIPILCIANLKNKSMKKKGIAYFVLSGKEKTLMLEKYNSNSSNCLVISGDTIGTQNRSIRGFIKSFLDLNPYTLILANMASHPQYSGKRLALFRDNPFLELTDFTNNSMVSRETEKLCQLRKFAHAQGCSKENQGTWFVRHIYPSSLFFEINQLYFDKGVKVFDAYDVLKNDENYREIECQIREIMS